MLLEQLYMIQEEVVLLLKSILEIHINTNIIPNISSLLKELIVDSIYSVEEKLLFQQAMFSQLTAFQKVLLFATFNLLLEIKVNIPDALEPMPLLLGTLMMEQEPESDYHQVQEKLFQDFAEPQLELLQVEEETKNQS